METYLGRFQQGDELPLVVQTTTQGGSPFIPLYNPVAKIYRDGDPPTLIEAVTLPADQQGVDTAVFRTERQLTSLYGTAGRYLVLFCWAITGGTTLTSCASFTLLPGGSPDGAAIGLFFLRRPNATYLIRQTDAGLLIRGKNPR